MRPQVLLVVALVAGACALLAWFSFRDIDRPPEPPPPEEVGAPERDRSGAPSEAESPDRPDAERDHRGLGVLTGVVVRDGEPVAARVELRFMYGRMPDGLAGRSSIMVDFYFRESDPAHPMRSSTAAGDGTFRFDELADGTYGLLAVAEDGATAVGSVEVQEDGPVAEARLEIVGGSLTLRGLARYEDGRPHRGVIDLMDERHVIFGLGGGVATNADGRFCFEHLLPGQVRLSTVVGGNRRVMSSSVTLPHEGEVEFVIDEGVIDRVGRVVADDDGKPVPGAVVMGFTREGGGSFARARTDQDGRFTLVITAGKVELQVMAAGFADPRRAVIEPGTPCIIRLERLAGVTGRVLSDIDGKPVAGVTVHASVFPESVRAISDEEGRYHLTGLPPGKLKLLAWGGGWVSRDLTTGAESGFMPQDDGLRVEAGKVVTQDIVVTRAGSARGRVLDAGGNPVAAAHVTARFDNMSMSMLMMGIFSPGTLAASAQTAGDGTFTIGTLLPGVMVYFDANPPVGAPASAGPFTVAAGGTLSVEIQLTKGRWIDVYVVEKSDRSPVVGAGVSPLKMVGEGSSHGISGRWVTNGQGYVRVGPLPEGTISFYVKCPGYARMLQNVSVPDPSATAVTVEMDRGRVLAGVVRFPDGSAAEGVYVSPSRFVNGHFMSIHMDGGVPKTDSDGAFRLEGLPSGRVKLSASHEHDGKRYRAEAQVEAGREDVNLALKELAPPKGRFVLTVCGPDGKPVPRAYAYYHTRGPHGSGYSGEEIEDGRCEERFSSRVNRQRWIEICNAEDASRKPLPLGAVLVGPLADDLTSLEVTLPAERTVEGIVLGPDGKGVPGVTITLSAVHPEFGQDRRLSGPDGSLTPRVLSESLGVEHGASRSGPDGTFRIGRLGSCGYVAQVKPPAAFAPVAPFKVASGTSDVRITLRAAARVRVTVLDADGRPVGGARVWVAERGGASGVFKGNTDVDGVAVVTGIDSQTVHLLDVRGPRGRHDLMPYRQKEWTPADTTVRLDRAFRLEGVVLDLAGQPVPFARVSHRMTASPHGFTKNANAQGSFKLDQLPAGRLVLRAVARDGDIGADSVTEIEVASSAGQVQLTIDPGADILVRITNWPLGAARHAYLLLAGEERARPRHTRDGIIHYSGFKVGTQAVLFIGPVGDGLCLLLNDLKTGEPEREAALMPGKTITGQILLPSDASEVRVTARVLGCGIRGTVAENGRFEIKGLPATGEWSVEAVATVAGKRIKGSVKAAPGASIEIDLR